MIARTRYAGLISSKRIVPAATAGMADVDADADESDSSAADECRFAAVVAIVINSYPAVQATVDTDDIAHYIQTQTKT
jgi:hypothetical protein